MDSIYQLDRVSNISFSNSRDLLVVTLAERVLVYKLFPFVRLADVPLQVRGYAATLSESGNLFVIGDSTSISGNLTGVGGAIHVYRDVLNQKDFSDPGILPLDSTPFSEVLLTDEGDLFVSSPTRQKVLRTNEKDVLQFLESLQAFYFDNVFLECDTPNQFSIFSSSDQAFYLSSALGSKGLELGPLAYNQRNSKSTDCFTPVPGNLSRGQKVFDEVRGTPLQYTLVNSDWFLSRSDEFIAKTAPLTFDANTADLTFVPVENFDGFVSFVRTDSQSINLANQFGNDLGAEKLGLIASDPRGEMILVATAGSSRLHRVRWSDGQFNYVGRFDLSQPIQQIISSRDGRDFVLVLGGGNRIGSEEILIIRNGDLIADFADLPSNRFSVELLQESLNQDFTANLNDDGILGRETRTVLSDLDQAINVDQILDVEKIPELAQLIDALFPLNSIIKK